MPNAIDEAFAVRMAALQAEWRARPYRPGDEQIVRGSVLQIIRETGATIPEGCDIAVVHTGKDEMEVRLVRRRTVLLGRL